MHTVYAIVESEITYRAVVTLNHTT